MSVGVFWRHFLRHYVQYVIIAICDVCGGVLRSVRHHHGCVYHIYRGVLPIDSLLPSLAFVIAVCHISVGVFRRHYVHYVIFTICDVCGGVLPFDSLLPSLPLPSLPFPSFPFPSLPFVVAVCLISVGVFWRRFLRHYVQYVIITICDVCGGVLPFDSLLLRHRSVSHLWRRRAPDGQLATQSSPRSQAALGVLRDDSRLSERPGLSLCLARVRGGKLTGFQTYPFP